MASGRRLDIEPNLRLADLKKRPRRNSRLTNIKVPAEVGKAVSEVAEQLGVTKTEVVIALLNHGLHVAAVALKKLRPRRVPRVTATAAGRVVRSSAELRR
ncbi:MAG: hypothetical protein N3C12_13675 [Candidatus Binatia bacterium]|nr:hypothetical protein [Candidatus Binatia bacterium]